MTESAIVCSNELSEPSAVLRDAGVRGPRARSEQESVRSVLRPSAARPADDENHVKTTTERLAAKAVMCCHPRPIRTRQPGVKSGLCASHSDCAAEPRSVIAGKPLLLLIYCQ